MVLRNSAFDCIQSTWYNPPFPVNRIAFIEFESEAVVEKMMEEAQGTEIQGRTVLLDFIGDKSKQSAGRGRESGTLP